MPRLPLFSRSTIKNDPLDSVIPIQENPGFNPDAPFLAPSPGGRSVRRKLTVHLSPDLIERVKNAAFWNPRLTITAIAEVGIRKAIEEVEMSHGGPYPPREQELRGGRPIK